MLTEFIAKHDLPKSFIDTAENYFIPVANDLLLRQKQSKQPLYIGINGCQGSGKSTLTSFLTDYLTDQHQLDIVNLSLDDFYLSKQARIELSQQVHPLLATRGVPGSHDIQLLAQTLTALKTPKADIKISKFNKATDDLLPQHDWPLPPEKIDIVFLEGWCWGVQPQTTEQLATPVNEFEKNNDTDGAWRNYVNEQLAQDYCPLYSLMDAWLMLKAPNFDCVANWRWQQEEKLAASSSGAGIMSKQEVLNFIQFYQRLTEQCLTTIPEKCNWLLTLNTDRNISQMIKKETT